MNLDPYRHAINSIELTPLTLKEGDDRFWHASITSNSIITCGGLSHIKEIAIRIAIAEFIERYEIKRIAESKLSSSFLLDTNPTSCGFAAGFDSDNTRTRSIAEAIERWCWSKWIDQQFPVTETYPSILSPITNSLIYKFDFVKYLTLKLDTSEIPNFEKNVNFYVILGFKDGGVFPGSRIDIDNLKGWEHCATEAWRHLLIYKSLEHKNKKLEFPINRIYHFGRFGIPKNLNITQSLEDWPLPKLKFSKSLPTLSKDVFVWRSIIENYIGWEIGNHARFVY